VVVAAPPKPRRRKAPPGSPVTDYAQCVVAGQIIAGEHVRLACQRHLDDLRRDDVRFAPELAQRAIDFFGRLRQSKGRWAGDPLTLQPWQAFVVGSIFGWRQGELRRFRNAYVSVARKNGKALALDTPLPTPKGWTTMGAIQVGDWVFDESGQPTRVTFASEIMYGRPCYEVQFSDGESMVADADHLWKTDSRWRGVGIRTTAEIANTIYAGSRDDRREHRHAVALAESLRLPEATLPVDPYVLGVWLGDGHTAAARLTLSRRDHEIAKEVMAAGVPLSQRAGTTTTVMDYSMSDGDRSQQSRDTSLQATLRELGVLGNKHIPGVYLRASSDQRLALLQGLMDTDGYVSAVGQCEFTSTKHALAANVVELVHSLGMKTSITERRAMLSGKDCGPYWRIMFWAYQDRPVCRLGRKRLRLKPRPDRPTRASRRHIVGAEATATVPVRCIQVSSPSSLYLAGRSMIPTHNTTLAAGVALYLLDFDDEPGAEVYAAATKRDQARLCWDEAARMVRKAGGLDNRVRIVDSRANMHVVETAAKFEALGADVDSLDGLNTHGAIIDELHAHKNRVVVDALETSAGARLQPLFLYITTAGLERESIYSETDDYAKRVAKGSVDDDGWFVFVAGLDEEDAWTDSAVYEKANPSLGVTIQIEELEQERDRALQVPGRVNVFKRLRLNKRTGQFSAWFLPEQWDACRYQGAMAPDWYTSDDRRQSAEAEELRIRLTGKPCFAGLDLASTTDVAAFVLLFPDPEGDYVLPFFWVPERASARRAERDQVPYQDWIDRGFITATPGDITDYDVIREDIRELAGRYRIRELAFDRWNATQLITQLQQDGATCVPIGQGFASLSAPSKELEGRIGARKIRHDGNPAMRWMVLNAEKEEDAAGNMKPSRARSADKIDGLVALIMAQARAMVSAGDGRSVYETRGLVTV
jgi:phage terminase large subunit-like protein